VSEQMKQTPFFTHYRATANPLRDSHPRYGQSMNS
jgi:hypothetical protein